MRIVLSLVKRLTDAKGIPDEQVAQWMHTPDWQLLLKDVRSHQLQQNASPEAPRQLLTQRQLERLQQLVHLEGQPLSTAVHVNASDAPPASSELAAFHPQIQQYLEETRDAHFFLDRNPAHFPSGKRLLELPPEQRIHALRAAVDRLLFLNGKLPSLGPTIVHHTPASAQLSLPLSALINRLLRAALPLTETDLDNLLSLLFTSGLINFTSVSLAAVLTAIERYAADHPLSPSMVSSLRKIESRLCHPRQTWHPVTPSKTDLALAEKIARLLGQKPSERSFDASEPWSAALAREILTLTHDLRPKWDSLLSHVHTAKGSKPSNKWLATAKQRIDAFGTDHFHRLIMTVFPLVAQPRTDLPILNHHAPDPNYVLSDSSQQLLKGLAWAAATVATPEVCTSLGDLGEACFKKIPWLGPRSKLAGNAVLASLSLIASEGNPDAVAQLTRISGKLKHASARAMANKAIQRAADSTGQTREDLEEISLPSFNLSPDSTLTQPIEGFTCTLAVSPTSDASIIIKDADGKVRKTVPTVLKSNSDYKGLKKQLKNATDTLAAQRHRIERLFMAPDRFWSFADWKSRYLDHPLLASFARRLIWQFHIGSTTSTAIPRDGKLLQSNDSPLNIANEDCRVQIWHPSTSTAEVVRAWRNFLQQKEITQPFKQAHREIYLLTDAERQTATYSNRFAANIIRQHPLAALCSQRGWNYHLMGAWDGHNVPTLELPEQRLKAEFWVEQIDDGPDMATTDLGISTVLATDQVRFYRIDGPAPQRTRARMVRFMATNQGNVEQFLNQRHGESVSLAEVPPQLFSEIMRDIDLFVAVSSVGNDPTWQDGGPQGRYRDYWQSFSFGDLTESAKTRRAVLESLLPRLTKIKDRCSLSDKFLLVQGHLRSYKIHLGSGNILMSPNDQYLCIVPDARARTSPDNLFLPFEGDSTLSIILSKAFLLADDKSIKDPSITRQITR